MLRKETPPRPVSAVFQAAADTLREAIKTIEKRVTTVPASSRLWDGLNLLVDVAGANSLPSDAINQKRAFKAFHAAFDFSEIALFLPTDRIAVFRKDVRKALSGSLSERDLLQEPFQLQSQLRIGAALRRAGLTPEIPRLGRGKSPDFVVQNATNRYAVEVKRPTSTKALARLTRDAQPQLAAVRNGGVLVIDLTTLIGNVIDTDVEGALKRFTAAIHNEIWRPERGFNVGFEKTVGLVIVARATERVEISEGKGFMRVVNFANGSTFANTDNNLVQRRAEWLTTAIQRGLVSEDASNLRDLQAPSTFLR